MTLQKLFLLSPARMDGVRAGYLLRPAADFALAVRLRQTGLSLAEAFAFASGLYFRGKFAYARRFGRRPRAAVRVITTNAGLLDPLRLVQAEDLRRFGDVAIHQEDPRFHGPLRRHAAAWAKKLAPDGQAILLGSIATVKYREVLLEAFGERLVFPIDFIGRGDMSRGALLLHAAQAGHELPYAIVRGAVFKGRRAERWQATLQRAKRG